jgi:hypothetical protein
MSIYAVYAFQSVQINGIGTTEKQTDLSNLRRITP